MPKRICLRIVNAFDHLLAIILPITTGIGTSILLVNWAAETKSGASEAIAVVDSILAVILGMVWFVGVATDEMRISKTPAIAIEFLEGIKEGLADFSRWLFS